MQFFTLHPVTPVAIRSIGQLLSLLRNTRHRGYLVPSIKISQFLQPIQLNLFSSVAFRSPDPASTLDVETPPRKTLPCFRPLQGTGRVDHITESKGPNKNPIFKTKLSYPGLCQYPASHGDPSQTQFPHYPTTKQV